MPKPLLPHQAMEIVPAKLGDMHVVADIVRSSASWYHPLVDQQDMAEHAVDDNWARENYKRRDFYVGLTDQGPVGTLSLQFFGEYAYLGYVYLYVQQVGKGYGQVLMRFAETLARDRGMKGLVLIGHPEATWAKRAYLKYGFKVIARSKDEVLTWNGGVLRPYYEQGFELYCKPVSPQTSAPAISDVHHTRSACA